MKLRSSVMNEDMISSAELSRAACCNLGESFVTNPSSRCELFRCGNMEPNKLNCWGCPGTLCADVDGKYSELSGSRPNGLGACPRSVDAEHKQVSKGTSSVEEMVMKPPW